MKKILPRGFFQRPALDLAPLLLGKFLVRRTEKGELALPITEVEAYAGVNDLASHSAKKRSERTKAIFEAGGVWYVYFVYGMHFMLNAVAGERGDGEAVLIRAVEGVNGPGRVAKKFGVSKADYGRPIAPKSGLYVEDRGIIVPESEIVRSPRVGVSYAGPIWSKKDYNFKIKK